MGFFDTKENKIKKSETAKNSAGIIRLLPKIKDYVIYTAALEALGRIGDDPAVDELIKLFDKDQYRWEIRCISALKLANNPKASNFIKRIYLDEKKRRNDQPFGFISKMSDFELIAKNSLLELGDVDALMDEIGYQNYYVDNKISLDKDHIQFLCKSIKNHIHQEPLLLKIILESKVHALCLEALNKINNVNNLSKDNLKKIIYNIAITEDILQKISNELVIEVLSYIKYGNTIEDEKYKIFDILLSEIRKRGAIVTYNSGASSCKRCDGKGTYIVSHWNDDARDHDDYTVQCSTCKATGKVATDTIQSVFNGSELKFTVFRSADNRIVLIQ